MDPLNTLTRAIRNHIGAFMIICSPTSDATMLQRTIRMLFRIGQKQKPRTPNAQAMMGPLEPPVTAMIVAAVNPAREAG